jgi:hypothetical protein
MLMKKLLLIAFIMAFVTSGAMAASNTFKLPMPPVQTDSNTTPDAYGYTWVDNDNGGSPVYNWVDITGIGQRIDGLMDDNTVGPFDIGFDFPFYWYTVDHFWVGSNGHISFSSDANYAQDFAMIPNTGQPNDLIVPLAGDIDFTSGHPWTRPCSAFYYTNNVDSVVVSWIGVPEWDIVGSQHTFQLILCKQDSSITFQYGIQNGTFTNPDQSCQIGIEDLIGNNGLRYMFGWAPVERIPHDGLVIRIHADPDPNFIFHDVGVHGGMNLSSAAIFHRINTPLTLKAYIKNYGTVAEDDITVNCRVFRQYSQIYSQNASLAHIEPGDVAEVEFPLALTPDQVSVHTIIFRTTMGGDQFYFNNTDTTELRTYNFPNAPFTYCDTLIEWTSWQGGGGGFATEFVAPEDIDIIAVRAGIQSSGSQQTYVYLMPADDNGVPDTENILFGDTLNIVNPTGFWYNINLPVPVTFYTGQKFFAATLSGGDSIYFGMDTSWPLSNRGWENTGSYAPSRDRTGRDVGIAIVCDEHTGIGDEFSSLPTNFSLYQNYPNPFNANTEIIFDLNAKSEIVLEVYNIAGQKIATLANGNYDAGSHGVVWNGITDAGKVVSSGVYFYNLKVNDFSQTRKMVLLK